MCLCCAAQSFAEYRRHTSLDAAKPERDDSRSPRVLGVLMGPNPVESMGQSGDKLKLEGGVFTATRQKFVIAAAVIAVDTTYTDPQSYAA